MTVPWSPVPSPDGVKATSWRVKWLVSLATAASPSDRSRFFDAVLDTGAMWTTFTEDVAHAAGIDEITSGPATTVRWFGTSHKAWSHRITLQIFIEAGLVDSITISEIDALFVRNFMHAATGRPVSLAVLGMDAVSRLQLTLDGPAAATRF